MQLVAVLVGGVLAGGLLIASAFPEAVGAVPPAAVLGAAGTVAVLTVLVARRLRPLDHGRSRR